MSAPPDLPTLYAAFAERNGLPDFPAADGTARLTFDGTVDVEFQPLGHTLFIHTSLGPLPAGDEELILRSLLASNGPPPAADQPVLALDPKLGDIVLHTGFPVGATDAGRLTAGVRALLDARERCLEGLRRLTAAMDGPSPGLPSGPDSLLIIRC